MRKIRYRTEHFSGEGIRDAAEVMAYETFVLGNSAALEYLRTHTLKGSSLIPALLSMEQELNDNGFVDDMGQDDKLGFFKEVLADLSKAAGKNITHALWLADLPAVMDKSCGYGRHLTDDSLIDAYEVGSVILSDLGYDGALYGYESCPSSALHSYQRGDLRTYEKLTRHTIYLCPRCGNVLHPSDVAGYPFVCFSCDENFYTIEAVSRPVWFLRHEQGKEAKNDL